MAGLVEHLSGLVSLYRQSRDKLSGVYGHLSETASSYRGWAYLMMISYMARDAARQYPIYNHLLEFMRRGAVAEIFGHAINLSHSVYVWLFNTGNMEAAVVLAALLYSLGKYQRGPACSKRDEAYLRAMSAVLPSLIFALQEKFGGIGVPDASDFYAALLSSFATAVMIGSQYPVRAITGTMEKLKGVAGRIRQMPRQLATLTLSLRTRRHKEP